MTCNEYIYIGIKKSQLVAKGFILLQEIAGKGKSFKDEVGKRGLRYIVIKKRAIIYVQKKEGY